MIKFNPFLGNFDFVGGVSGGGTPIRFDFYTVDPPGAVNGDAWIFVQSPSTDVGNLLYFHGAMPVTQPQIDDFYFSVKTASGIKRVELT